MEMEKNLDYIVKQFWSVLCVCDCESEEMGQKTTSLFLTCTSSYDNRNAQFTTDRACDLVPMIKIVD